ncbi:hypothetical protein NL676_022522 [Syzygium grande]|nr:hypothetical protein NL676_022522 [Syzygium grande]
MTRGSRTRGDEGRARRDTWTVSAKNSARSLARSPSSSFRARFRVRARVRVRRRRKRPEIRRAPTASARRSRARPAEIRRRRSGPACPAAGAKTQKSPEREVGIRRRFRGEELRKRESERTAAAMEEREEEEEEEEEEEFEFTFACANPEGSPVAADAVFENGKIRPVYPFFDQKLLFANGGGGDGGSSTQPPQLRSPLRKLFVEGRGSASTSSSSSSEEGDELEGVPEGTYCVWRGKAGEEGAEASPEGCRKSNSTGFSKLWRLKELGRRSSSDGKDAFVFLNPRRRGKGEVEKEGGKAASATTSKGGKKGRAAAAAAAATAEEAHERHYVMARAAKEGEKRKSYLPYKQVGFFTNVNGMSRNVHPF